LLTASAGRRRRGSRSARSGAADCFLQMQKSGFPLPSRLCRDLMVRRPARRPGRRSCPRATPLIRLSAPRWRPGRKPPTRPRQASQPLGRRRECPPAHARCRRRGLVCVCGGGVALATRARSRRYARKDARADPVAYQLHTSVICAQEVGLLDGLRTCAQRSQLPAVAKSGRTLLAGPLLPRLRASRHGAFGDSAVCPISLSVPSRRRLFRGRPCERSRCP
jgi:hypothetical protein